MESKKANGLIQLSRAECDRIRRRHLNIVKKYPPSEACACEICRVYCIRPGWWTVEEARKAIAAGYASRMMLEIAPEFTFGVLAPAFRGCESGFALQAFAASGCNFLKDNLCELHGTGFQPLECRFCHHNRKGQGRICHGDLERDWNTAEGQKLIQIWLVQTSIITKK